MTYEAVTSEIKKIMINALDLEINPHDIQNDEALSGGKLALSSVTILELLFAIEDEFGIEFSDDDLRVELFMSVDAIASYVMTKLNCR